MQPDRNLRKSRRVRFQVPVTIKVRDANDVEQLYEGRVVDASSTGMKIRVKRFIRRQTVLFLTLPFPTRFRACSLMSETYHAYAIVVHSKKFAADDFEIGVKLLPNKPSANFKPFTYR